jgi:CBS domain-containing protein
MEKIAVVLERKPGDIWTVTPATTVFDAIAMMADRDIGSALVVADGGLVGILSERDYARKIILQGRASRDTLVGDVMTPDPITVSPEHSVDECLRIMTEHRIRHLPVVDQGRLLGLVSIGDLVNAIILAQAQTIEHLHTYIAGAAYPAGN